MIKEWGKRLVFGGAAALFLPAIAAAHEVYVLDKEDWRQGLAAAPVNLLAALNDPGNLTLALTIALCAMAALVVAIAITQSRLGQKVDDYLLREADIGRLILRIALAAALFIGAQSSAVLGPEIRIVDLPLPQLISYLLYALSALTLVGWLTEQAAAVLIVIYGLVVYTYGAYALTYLSYFGVFLGLLLFGAGRYSIDRHFSKDPAKHTSHTADLEALMIRVAYGLAFIYTAVSVKFLHPAVSLAVVNHYDLTQFHYLFPSDPILVVLGAGIVECVIGLALILGLQVRLIIFFSLFHMTLSLFYFGEAAWPHLVMYGVSAYLIYTNGGRLLSLDRFMLAARK